MDSLFYFLFWAVMIFLMMRMGCGRYVTGHGAADTRPDGAPGGGRTEVLRWEPPPRDTDPVCGNTVSTATAKPSVFDGHVYYFCSSNCREAFEAAPDIYLSETPQPRPKRLEQSHG